MNNSNILLTGVPRSGTTLTCHLLNQVPDVVALHEPMNVGAFCEMSSHEDVLGYINEFFENTYNSIISNGMALSRHSNGVIPDNPFANELDPETGARLMVQDLSPTNVTFENILNSDFSIIVKHTAAFTALLELLVKYFPVYAVIRNPLSVLMSWNTLDIPISRGHAPMAECVDPELKQSLKNIPDKLDRQIYLLSWWFRKYHMHLSKEHVIRYEDVIASGGSILEQIVPVHGIIDGSLKSKNNNLLYNQTLRRDLVKRLSLTDDLWGGWHFYSKDLVLGDN